MPYMKTKLVSLFAHDHQGAHKQQVCILTTRLKSGVHTMLQPLQLACAQYRASTAAKSAFDLGKQFIMLFVHKSGCPAMLSLVD